ncbi:sulfatase-like hydrolase/transferase [Natronomonas halophila]|uniref:sulfatase-like hydrolase/transferase n=1 Tax=Natronomonas halophila TaxID=2747817 RepID=UPI0015B5577F|nr:sulfatase-like hydrolase/transferase [Natronomonas halophila]QLD87132.1 sulfatase-like hydrolase/transferase [Natronomonas halophila]
MSSVALVVLDTLRYDYFEEIFDWLDGARFTRTYSTSHWTVPAHASLFTGRYASEVGVHGSSPTLECPEGTVAEAFQAAGYRTRCLTANPQLYQYDGWDRGFDEFVGAAGLTPTAADVFDWAAHIEETNPGLGRYLSGLSDCLFGDCNTVRSLRHGYELYRTPTWDGGAKAVKKRLEATDFADDEFLFVNLMEAHTPYHPPTGGDDPVSVVIADAIAEDVTDPETVRAAYRTSVEYLSEVYREIFAELESSFDYVITLSDHGELLGEHGLWNHSIGLHPELIHVPLVISGPDITPGLRNEVTSLLDVHRTTASLAGIDVDSRGRNLFEPLDSREFLFESHGLLPFHRAQFERKGLSEAEFRHWQTPLNGFVDGDGNYCYETEPGDFRVIGDGDLTESKRRLDDLVEGIEKRDLGDANFEVSDGVRARLEELGYA